MIDYDRDYTDDHGHGQRDHVKSTRTATTIGSVMSGQLFNVLHELRLYATAQKKGPQQRAGEEKIQIQSWHHSSCFLPGLRRMLSLR